MPSHPHSFSRLSVLPSSRIITVRDEEHAKSLLQGGMPDLSDDERDQLARQLASGVSIPVESVKFEF